MSYSYSSFISYRRNFGDEKFVKKFKAIIESEAAKVTNISKVFFDDDSINWGEEFDEKIYLGILDSYFFIPIYHNSYLHEDNLWCAKELFRAIQVERKIRETAAPNYCFILPIIDRGSADDFPDCMSKKNGKDIKKFRHHVLNNTTSSTFETFKDNVYNILYSNFRLLNKDIKFREICVDIETPSDDEIRAWIKEQKTKENESEAKRLPILTK